MTIAQVVADRICAARVGGLPPALFAEARNRLLDYLAVTIAAWDEPETRAVHAYTAASGQGVPSRADRSGTVTIILGRVRASAADGAFANATMGHVRELDDEHHGMIGHPGVVVVPACLAVAEQLGSSGDELLRAIVIGYEVVCRVGMAIRPGVLHERGFHPTGVCGPFGAAAGAGYLMGLDAAQLADALGIAGSMASSIFEFVSDGAWTKRLHPGFAARSGIMAAQLASAGFSGPAAVFEGPFGFLHAYAGPGTYDPDAIVRDWGQTWEISRTAYKPYACCSYIHSAVDVVLDIIERHALAADEIASIDLRLSEAMLPIIAEPRAQKLVPRNVVDAQFSVYFAVAASVLSKTSRAEMTTFAECFRPDQLVDRRILALSRRIRCQAEPAFSSRFPWEYPASATILMADGHTYAGEVPTHRGDPLSPGAAFTPDQVMTRFNLLLRDSPLIERSSAIIDIVSGLGPARDGESYEPRPGGRGVRALATLLQSGAA